MISYLSPPVAGEKWYSCELCRFKTKKKKMMMSHGITEHQMNKPFKCSICDYEGLSDTIIKNHLKTNHPNECESGHVVTFYKMVRLYLIVCFLIQQFTSLYIILF